MTIVSVTGVSNSAGIGVPGLTPTIYGGISGLSTGGTCASGQTDGINTCNNCTGQTAGTNCSATDTSSVWPYCTCNTSRIYDSLNVSITFISQAQYEFGALVYLLTGGSGTPISLNIPYEGPGIPQTITLPWSQVCQYSLTSSPTTCEGAGSQNGTLRLEISNGGTYALDSGTISVVLLDESGHDLVNDCTATSAICNFLAYPADAGIYMEQTQGDYTNLSGLRVFISNQDFAHANPNSAVVTQDLQVNSDGSIPNEYVGGLNNDPPNPYYVRVASLDLAKNVFNFTSDSNILNYGSCTTACTAGPPVSCDPASGGSTEGSAGGPGGYMTDGCRYVAEPDQVLGLLSKDLNCFIATAAYGSSLEPKLKTFRAFRHQFLLRNPYGRKFVEAYYHWGPYAAQWIYDHDWSRSIVRAGLWPLWAFAELSLAWGLQKALLVSFAILFLLAAGIVALASWIRKSVAKPSY